MSEIFDTQRATRWLRNIRLSRRTQGICLMILAVSLFACLDASAKLSRQFVPSIEVVWFRFAVHFVLAAAFLNPWTHPSAWKTKRPVAQLSRASIQVVCTGLNFFALGYLQLAQTLSIQFLGPIFVTILSVIFLHERVTRHHWLAVVIGFLGILVVTRPGIAEIHWAFGVTLASVIIGAGYMILTRSLSVTQESSGSMLLTMAAVPTVLLLPVLAFIWQTPPSLIAWLSLLGTGVFGALSHYILILANQRTSASTLAPFQYVQMVAVVILGFAIFGDIPSIWTLLGAIILVGSGLYMFRADSKVVEPVPGDRS